MYEVASVYINLEVAFHRNTTKLKIRVFFCKEKASNSIKSSHSQESTVETISGIFYLIYSKDFSPTASLNKYLKSVSNQSILLIAR